MLIIAGMVNFKIGELTFGGAERGAISCLLLCSYKYAPFSSLYLSFYHFYQ